MIGEQWEICEVYRREKRRGHLWITYYVYLEAIAIGPDGRRTVGTSREWKYRELGDKDEDPAIDAMVHALVADGWQPLPSRAGLPRFRRRVGLPSEARPREDGPLTNT
jgi:hypothetical protein